MLGFSYREEELEPIAKPKGRRNRQFVPSFNKDQYMQAAFTFVLRPPLTKGAAHPQGAYVKYLSDPNQLVDWKDVVELFYIPNVTSTREKTQCPICMEPAPLMTTPRVTKCGHLYCWPCLLQYLAFEREYSWKKCPLCADPIYKNDIRRVTILQVGQDDL